MWSYNVSDLATSEKDQVRLLIADTTSKDQLVADEEILFSLTQRSSIYGAAAMLCRSLATQFARQADTVQETLRVMYSSKMRAYNQMAMQYEAQSVGRSGVSGYAGGISIADKIREENNTDRVPPNFNIGMTDNLNQPITPAGNEPATVINEQNV